MSLPSASVCPLVQRAEALKYSGALVWSFAEIEPNTFALYDQSRTLQYIGTWEEILPIYLARPVYTPRPQKVKHKIDLQGLEFKL